MSEQHIPKGFERRREDYPHITGRGQFVDDIRPPMGKPLHMIVMSHPGILERVFTEEKGRRS